MQIVYSNKHQQKPALYNDPVPDSYLLHAFVIENAYHCRLQPVASLKVGRYISEFQHSIQGIYTRTARIIYSVDYVKTYS